MNELHLVQRMHEIGWTLTAEILDQFKQGVWFTRKNNSCDWVEEITGAHPPPDRDAWLNCPVVQRM